ncbi:MAG: LysM peptidoglycan-binding domain-containing protein [Actinobacteria bacterium]|nr:LysM peptidoglycan-binding domain-containing protein [Actinomycetota bacterium]
MASTFTHPIDPLLATMSARRAPVAPASTERRSTGTTGPSLTVFRRRRLTVAAVSLFSVFSVVLATTALATDPSADIPPAPRTLVARPGDTIWGIARQIAPSGDITELVDALILTNGSQIKAGQIVRIP